jgi:hypothetical protein
MKNAKTISTTIEVNASKEKVWDALYTRFGETYLFNPNLTGSHFSAGNTGEVGCERECQLDSRTHIREKITNAIELKQFSLEVVGGNMPLVQAVRVDIKLSPLQANKTKVLLDAHFTTKPAFMASLMKMPFKKMFVKLLIGLKYYLETGKTVSKETFKPVAKAYKHLQPSQSF